MPFYGNSACFPGKESIMSYDSRLVGIGIDSYIAKCLYAGTTETYTPT